MHRRDGFTLLEMLISTVLLSLVLLGLYGALNLQQNSTRHLREYLDKAIEADRGVMVLYRDILQSNGVVTITNGEFDRLCLGSTTHTLHTPSDAKVCWVVAKEGQELLRIEGGDFHLPLRSSEGVEVDTVMKPMALFDLQKDKHNVLVALQKVGSEPFVFLVQGIEPPPKVVKKPRKPRKPRKPGKKPGKKPGGKSDKKPGSPAETTPQTPSKTGEKAQEDT